MKSEREIRNWTIDMLDMAEFSCEKMHDEYYKGQLDAYKSMLRFLEEDDDEE